MTGKENTKRAIHFDGPDHIPLLIYGLSRIEESDIAYLPVETMFGGESGRTSEWGFTWKEDDSAFALGQIERPAFEGWERLGDYTGLAVDRTGRFNEARKVMASHPDKYFIADFVLSGFTVMAFARGFENLMMDFHAEPDNIGRLADIVFGREEELIRACAAEGFDAVGFADDWGTQRSLLISPELFREIYKPRYKRQIDLAHSLDLDVFMHSCGHIIEIIPDMIEIGLDILNPGQPSLNGVEELGNRFKGRICFACPVSYQTTGITGNRRDIENEIKDYIRFLSDENGGLIGMVATKIMELGATREAQDAITEGWLRLSRGGYI